MHAIVTGGAGFIGSNLVRELQRLHPEARLSVVDDFSSGSWRNLVGFGGDLIARSCEELDWERTFMRSGVSCIYHLASITDTTVSDQREMLERNVEAFRRVLEYSSGRGIRVVYASSAATYGLAEGLMHEALPAAAANVYGFSKSILDNLAQRAADDGQTVLGVRYFNVYGPGEAHKGRMASMVFQLYQQLKAGERPRIFRAGEQRRDFVYIEDAVAATVLAGEQGDSGVFNVGSGQARSFNELVSALRQQLDSQLEAEYIDNPYNGAYQNHTQAELSLSRDVLGYEPLWSLEQGVADYVAWLERGSPTQSWTPHAGGTVSYEDQKLVHSFEVDD